jgi:SAM-dependent methyltransferase
VTAQSPGVSAYYQHATSFASCISWQVRQKMFRIFMEYFQPGPEITVLDVGVTSDDSFQESNYFEQLYPYAHRITCVGTEDASHLEARYPGLLYRRVQPGQALPFDRAAFDIVFSNAVIEHVGSRTAQAAFVRELCRVGKAFFITTPNRWFPVEHHSGLPLLHFLPTDLYRSLLRRTPYCYWAREEHLNMMTAAELAGLFPSGWQADIRRIRVAGLCSNLVALGRVA